jgi:hypothetical protein
MACLAPHGAPSSACLARHSSCLAQFRASRCASTLPRLRTTRLSGWQCRIRSRSSPMRRSGRAGPVVQRVRTSRIRGPPWASHGFATTRPNRAPSCLPRRHCARPMNPKAVRAELRPAMGRGRVRSPALAPRCGGPGSPRSAAPALCARMTAARRHRIPAEAPERDDQGCQAGAAGPAPALARRARIPARRELVGGPE